MPVVSVPFGPAVITIGATPFAFECEVLGGKITHAYEDIGSSRTMACGTERAAETKRVDGLSFNLENDLTAAGLYSYLMTNDRTTVAFSVVLNTANGAEWTGDVQLRLPSEIGADEYGAPIASSVAWVGVGEFTWTPGTGTRTTEAEAA